MIGTRWPVAVGLALLALASGCVSCGYDVCKPVLDAAPFAEAPVCDRPHVYAFLINGVAPSGLSGLDDLRLRLAERGYEKIYCTDLCTAPWIEFEMKRVKKCDSLARFVLVGYDLGATAAAVVGRHAARRGLPIDAVVLLDPVSAREGVGCCRRVVLVRSGIEAPTERDCECVDVPESGHWSLPTNEKTVAAIAAVLKDVAAKVEHPPVAIETLFDFEDAPPPRAVTVPPPDASADWLFLYDVFGTHTQPLAPLPPGLESCCPADGLRLNPPVPEKTEWKDGDPLPIPRKLLPGP